MLCRKLGVTPCHSNMQQCDRCFSLLYTGSDLKWLQQVSDVFPHGAGALHRDGVVLVSQGQPVANDHIDISQTDLQGRG